ncbi:MAG: immunoglobulin domain-containing protein, partial [Verrucomicrobiota bacterium]
MKTNSISDYLTGHTRFDQQKQFLTLLLLCAWPGASITRAQSPAGPQIKPPSSVEHKAVYAGENTSVSVVATGTAPLSFQWRLDGRDLTGQTNTTLSITNARAADEGDYTVLVTNAFGQAANRPAHLFVVPEDELLVRNYTNELGRRLPYLCIVPQNYDPSLRYSLFVGMAGAGVNENNYRNFFGSGGLLGADGDVLTSYRERDRRPTIMLSPLRRSSEQNWNPVDLPLVVGMINQLVAQYSIATNQIHLWGFSDGGGASVTLLETYPNLFASGLFVSGTGLTTKPSLFEHVPLWVVHAADDSTVNVSSARNLVSALRQAGGTPIYSEFASGGHLIARVTLLTPLLMDWLLEQRLGTAPTGPMLSINSPTQGGL